MVWIQTIIFVNKILMWPLPFFELLTPTLRDKDSSDTCHNAALSVCLSVLFPQMPVLIAATVASDKPTDGYLVKDIISILTSGIHSTNSFSSASVPVLHCLGMKRGGSIDSKYTCMEGESSGRTCFWNCIWTCA